MWFNNQDIEESDIRRLIDAGATIVPTLSVPFALAYERRGDPKWGVPPLPGFRRAPEPG